MTVTLNLPPNVEQAFLAEAQAKGLSLGEFISDVLLSRTPGQQTPVVAKTVFEQGLGLFGSPEDAALLDEVVSLAYEERRRPTKPSRVL